MQQMTVGMIREHHRYLVLRELLQRPMVQRGELAALSGVSTMTIKKVVDDLLARGLVCETKVESEAGRKPQALAIAPQYGCVACLNLSSKTSIKARLVDIFGNELFATRHPLGADYTATLRAALVRLAGQVAACGLTCVGLGMAVPSVYYPERDEMNSDLIAAFDGLHPRAFAAGYFPGTPIHILQDVRAAALEHCRESGAESLYYLYLGDGVGGCFVQGGVTLGGANAVAGEVGQCLPLPGSGERLEQLLSTAGLRARLGLGSGQPLADAYGMNMELFEEAAGHAARFIYNLNWIVNPGEIVVDSNDPFFASLVAKRATALAAENPSAIQNPLAVRNAPGGQSLANKGLFNHVRDAWLKAAAEAPIE